LPLSEYLIQHLMAEVDLKHDEGRAKLKALAAPLFARMPRAFIGKCSPKVWPRGQHAGGGPQEVVHGGRIPKAAAERLEPALPRRGRMSVGRVIC